MIEWDKVDLLTCFEAEPAVGEDGLSFLYVTERAGYRLAFELWPYDEKVWIELRGPGQSLPLVEVWLQSCTAVRYANADGVERLTFRYRDPLRGQPSTRQVSELRVRPEFSLVMTR